MFKIGIPVKVSGGRCLPECGSRWRVMQVSIGDYCQQKGDNSRAHSFITSFLWRKSEREKGGERCLLKIVLSISFVWRHCEEQYENEMRRCELPEKVWCVLGDEKVGGPKT